jgi:hypothetical protein
MAKKPKRIKVVISRKKWLRGGNGNAVMSTSTGMKCCLGHVATACGIKREHLISRGDPGDVSRNTPASEITKEFSRLLCGIGIKAVNDAIHANDSETMPAKQREKEIADILAPVGFDISFKD